VLLSLCGCISSLPSFVNDSGSCQPYLISQNNYSYVCSVAKASSAVVEDLACMQYDSGTGAYLTTSGTSVSDQDASTSVLTCPNGGSIQCFVYASYGNVAGSCYECQNKQGCGTCQDCVWKDRCGYQAGGCFGNCIDCFGETCDPPGSASPGCAAYLPEEVGSGCIGQQSCTISLSGSGQSASWIGSDHKSIPVTNQPSAVNCHGVDAMAKLKVLAVCSPRCENKCDITGECGNPQGAKCANLVKKYPCADYYAKGKEYEGWCDQTCGYGACA